MLTSDNSTGWHVCKISFCTLINLEDQGVYLTVAGSWHGNSDSHFSSTCVCTLRNVLKTYFGKSRTSPSKPTLRKVEVARGGRWRFVTSSHPRQKPMPSQQLIWYDDIIAHTCTRRPDGLLFHSAWSWKVCGVWDADTSQVSVFTGTFPPLGSQTHSHIHLYARHLTQLPIYTHTQGKSCVCCAEGVGG